MARFKGTIQGTRGETSRLGDAKNGLTVTANGWDAGIEIRAYADYENPENDVLRVYVTGGSNGSISARLVARVSMNPSWDAPRVELITRDGNGISWAARETARLEDAVVLREEVSK